MSIYDTATGDYITVRVNLEQCSAGVDYRFDDAPDDHGWQSTVYQTASLDRRTAACALKTVEQWLEGQGG